MIMASGQLHRKSTPPLTTLPLHHASNNSTPHAVGPSYHYHTSSPSKSITRLNLARRMGKDKSKYRDGQDSVGGPSMSIGGASGSGSGAGNNGSGSGIGNGASNGYGGTLLHSHHTSSSWEIDIVTPGAGEPVRVSSTWARILAEPSPSVTTSTTTNASNSATPTTTTIHSSPETPPLRSSPPPPLVSSRTTSTLKTPSSRTRSTQGDGPIVQGSKLLARGPTTVDASGPFVRQPVDFDGMTSAHNQFTSLSLDRAPDVTDLFGRPSHSTPPLFFSSSSTSSRGGSRRTSINASILPLGSDPLGKSLLVHLTPDPSTSYAMSSGMESPHPASSISISETSSLGWPSVQQERSQSGSAFSGESSRPLLEGLRANSDSHVFTTHSNIPLDLNTRQLHAREADVRRTSIASLSSFTPIDDALVSKNERRPSAPQTSLLGKMWTPHQPPLITTSTKTTDPLTRFGASLESYRFGTSPLQDETSPHNSSEIAPRILGQDKEHSQSRMLTNANVMKALSTEIGKVGLDHHRHDSASSLSVRGSDKQRDAEVFARTLSYESPSRSSLDSSSTSFVARSGRTGSLASSMRYPLLGRGDRRSSSSTTSRYSSSREPDVFILRPMPISQSFYDSSTAPMNPSMHKPSHAVKSQNPFLPLRRRFIPHSQGRRSRVETQLLGELLLALEDYVAAYGRRVRVSGPTVTTSSPFLTATHTTPTGLPIEQFSSFNTASSSMDHQNDDQATSPLVSTLQPNPSSNSAKLLQPQQLEHLLDRRDIFELAEEVDQTAKEVVEVCPAFGTALTLGLYGPLAVRTTSDVLSIGQRYAQWAPPSPSQRCEVEEEAEAHDSMPTTTYRQPPPSLSSQGFGPTRFSDDTSTLSSTLNHDRRHYNGISEDKDGDVDRYHYHRQISEVKLEENEDEPRWWAERLLRDLIEGLVGDGGWSDANGEEVALTGALAVLTEESPPLPSISRSEHHEDTFNNQLSHPHAQSRREQELMERGKRRWLAFQARDRNDPSPVP